MPNNCQNMAFLLNHSSLELAQFGRVHCTPSMGEDPKASIFFQRLWHGGLQNVVNTEVFSSVQFYTFISSFTEQHKSVCNVTSIRNILYSY